MKNNGLYVGILICINVVLVLICGLLYLTGDRKAPTMEFGPNDSVYSEGMDTDRLLTGVTSIDDRDGDISDRIVIEKITENKQAGKAVVFYAVSDSKGNVTRASREFDARYDEDTDSSQEEETAGSSDAIESTGDMESTEDTDKSDENSAENTDAEEDKDKEALALEEEKAAEEEAARKAEEEAKAEEEKKKAEEEAKKKAEEERKAAEAAAAADTCRPG